VSETLSGVFKIELFDVILYVYGHNLCQSIMSVHWTFDDPLTG